MYDLAIDFISILVQRPFYISIQLGMQNHVPSYMDGCIRLMFNDT